MPGLGASFGRGGATNTLQDLRNADCIVIEGSNMAECHPVGFQWVMEAKRRGAKVIHVDPRYTRTSAVADVHVPLRAGSDIAFLGGLVNYVVSNDAFFREYVVAYTNAATILRDDFVDTEDLDGLFSGWNPEKRSYDTSTWQYQGHNGAAPEPGDDPDSGPGSRSAQGSAESQQHSAGDTHGSGGPALDTHVTERDETLQHPRCVFQVLKRHFARYTPEMVEDACGIPVEQFLRVAQTIAANSGRERTTAWAYSVGWTQHSVGVQYIRTAGILQLLLGNVGRPGGGIMALRGHASIQGSTDVPTLYNLLPGYLPMATAGTHDAGLDAFVKDIVGEGQKGFWSNARSYTVSLLKAYFGDAATAENDYGFGWLPRINADHGTYQQTMDMLDDKIDGYFVVGENPAVGHANAKLQRLAFSHLKWMVVRDLAMIESATWWKSSPEIATGELTTEEIGTELFFFPAAAHTEKSGTFTQTQRVLQWRHKAVEPPGAAQSELAFYFRLGQILKERLADSQLERDAPMKALTWDYELESPGEPSGADVLKEINGYDLTTGKLLDGYLQMKPDGTTSGGCWIYSGVYKGGINQADRRVAAPGHEEVANEWGWAWPLNRRVLYNRASADPQGRPWSERKAYVWWDEEAGKWTGHDVPDFEATKPPSYRSAAGATGVAALNGDDPFIMMADGKGWLFAPAGVVDGPMPTHYEPHESPVRNPLYAQQANPGREVYESPLNYSNPSATEPHYEVFPYVFTTYRLTEHHTAGGMSRWLPYLSELQPEFFCEISPELAKERNLQHLGWATIISARTAIEARVLVTDRMVPLKVGGKVVHQIGLPYHWGIGGDGAIVEGDSANDLLGLALDPNVHIQEAKAASCDIQPGRRPRGEALLELVDTYRVRAGITVRTSNSAVTKPAVERAPAAGTTDGGHGE